jgi:hypothetical protein
MRKYVFLGPSGQIQPGPRRQKLETGRGEFLAALPRQHHVELGLERVQIEHVVGRVGDLRLGQRIGAPVGGLLLLGNVLAEQFLGEVLEAMPVRLGAGQP